MDTVAAFFGIIVLVLVLFLLEVLVVMWLFNGTDIATLENLKFGQTVCLVLAVNIMAGGASASVSSK